jgi:hypothetical protein
MDVFVRQCVVMPAALAALLALAGCQMTDPSIELLESEMRWMEDQLYALDQQLDQTCLQLASARNSNRALRRELDELKRQQAPAAVTPRPRAPAEESLAPPAIDVPNIEQFDERQLQPPKVDLGPSDAPSSDAPSQAPPSAAGRPRIEQDLDDFSRGADVDLKVARIVLNSRLTGGYDFDGRPGDEGLLLVVEPQNAAGQYLPLPGQLEVEVTDPSRGGSEARLARWEFDASETVRAVKKSLLGRGIHLQLPWPGALPRSETLLVSVRYTPPTGESFAARREIRVDLIAQRQNQEATISAGLPDAFLPVSPPRLSQLLPERALSAPAAPLDGPSSLDIRDRSAPGASPIPYTAAQPGSGQAVRNRTPRWVPFR